MANKKYDKYTSSYSGTDMIVSVVVPEAAPIVMGTATTLTYSVYRQLANVRTLGRITPRGFARGGRTYAGTIIFTVIKDSFVEELRERIAYLGKFKRMGTDELPPIDILLTFANEFGQSSTLNLYGVRFVDEGQTMSIEDIITENVMTFICEDVQRLMGDGKESYPGAQVFRHFDESIGKFNVNELIANVTAAERSKLLEEIAKLEAERWKEPVMSDPGNVPNFDLGLGTGDPGPPGSGSNNANGIGSLLVSVSDAKTNKQIPGATVWTTINGAKVTKTTGSNGIATFTGLASGMVLTVNASKTGYTSAKKNRTIANTSSAALNLELTSKPPSGMEPPLNQTYTARAYGKYADADKSSVRMTTSFKKSDTNDRPKIQVQNFNSAGIKNIDISWSWHITNWSVIKKKWFGNFGSAFFRETGSFESSKTNADGIGTIPYLDLGWFPNGTELMIIGKPSVTPGGAVAGKSLWVDMTFYVDIK